MTDPRQELVARYTTTGPRAQIELLAWLANRVTLHARGTSDSDGGVAESVRLRAFNEAQHRIDSQLFSMVTGNEQRYPDAVFANILTDQLTTLQLDPREIFERMPKQAGELAAE